MERDDAVAVYTKLDDAYPENMLRLEAAPGETEGREYTVAMSVEAPLSMTQIGELSKCEEVAGVEGRLTGGVPMGGFTVTFG